MKKMLLVLKPDSIDREAVDFGCYLAKLMKTQVVGVFIDETISRDHNSYSSAETQVPVFNEYTSRAGSKVQPGFDKALNQFSDACICRDTIYSLHKNHIISLSTLISESRFCDLLILDRRLSLRGIRGTSSSSLIKQTMLKSECPVILAPESFDVITEVVFTYDGSRAAVKAIKQFTYLFPEFSDRKISIVEVNATKSTFTNEPLLIEWFNSHYPHVEYTVLQGDPIEQLMTLLLPRNNAFVVMGSYSRNLFSRIIRKSSATTISEVVVNPIFIAH